MKLKKIAEKLKGRKVDTEGFEEEVEELKDAWKDEVLMSDLLSRRVEDLEEEIEDMKGMFAEAEEVQGSLRNLKGEMLEEVEEKLKNIDIEHDYSQGMDGDEMPREPIAAKRGPREIKDQDEGFEEVSPRTRTERRYEDEDYEKTGDPTGTEDYESTNLRKTREKMDSTFNEIKGRLDEITEESTGSRRSFRGSEMEGEIPEKMRRWIKKNLDRGFSYEELKKRLRKSGQDPSVVDRYKRNQKY